jgi:hypothetical protein
MELNGQTVKRRLVGVLMDFVTEEGCTLISSRLNDGYEVVTPSQIRTHIYCIDPEKMCYFSGLKHKESVEQWTVRGFDIPPLLDVEHGCALRH